jgi:hypothetical protein
LNAKELNVYGALEAGRPVAFGDTVRVTTLAKLMI